MKTILPGEMQKLEKDLFEKTPMVPELLMEKAAYEIVAYIKNHYGFGKVLFLCGPGNNGGDGLAAARLYQSDGGEAVIWQAEGVQSEQCKKQEELLKKLWPQVKIYKDIQKEKEEIKHHLLCIVDALFGTGLNQLIKKDLKRLIEEINRLPIPVLAVDIPSGIHGETGLHQGTYVQADVTLTFHRPKIGFYLNDGVEATGKIVVKSIGIPLAFDQVNGAKLTTKENVKDFLGYRKKNSHKGDYGNILIIAGSLGMAGAAILAGKGAIKTGGGLVTIACPTNIGVVIQQTLPEAMCICADDEEKMIEVIKKPSKPWNGIVFGPGFGREKKWKKVVALLAEEKIAVIWDADGLYQLKQANIGSLKGHHIMTPHMGEAAMLLGKNIDEIKSNPIKIAKTLWEKYQCQIILKGAKSILHNGKETSINPAGTPALAKGGSGDVLSGILVALVGRYGIKGKEHFLLKLMEAGCYIHGLAGEKAEEIYGENGVTPFETANAVAFAIKEIIDK